MTIAKNEARERTIFIEATCFADAQSAIELSVMLAEALNAGLRAYLFEDEAFYQSASLPFARAVYAGSTQKTVTPEAMGAAFKRDADAYRKALEDIAVRKSLNWTFEKRRGEIGRITKAEYGSGDMIVLGYQRLRRSQGEILVLDTANDLDTSLIELASGIANTIHAPLHTALFPENIDDETLVSPEAENMLRAMSEKIMIIKGDVAMRQFLQNIQRRSPSAIIASGDIVDRIGAKVLLEAGRCPLVISA